MNRNKFLFLFIFLFFLSVVNPAHASVLTDSFHKEFAKTANITKVTLDNVNGDCHFFMAPKRRKLNIDATITIKGPSDEACESYYRKVKIKVTKENGELKIVVNRPRSSSFFGLGNAIRMSVDFEIAIPRPMDVSVELVNGNVRIEAMKRCSVDVVNGDVKMEGIISASIEAVNSCMDIREVKKWVVIDAVNGNLKLTSSSPDLEKIKAEFVNGSMSVQIPTACLGHLNMDSATGTAVLKEKKKSGDWETRMHGKKLHISDKGKAKISLENVNGKITLLCD
ncbi:MAG: hypothetical protein GXO70_03050 [Acidobacteria bacterium]|nr:hypothetical protein [Acidobacteriota bacterium]